MEENKDISQIALEKIRESGMKPISKNVFNFKRVLFWSLVGFSVLVGVVSFSAMLSILFNNDWFLYNKFGFSFIFKSLPYFWILCLALFVILGEFYYRKTFLGYRHNVVVIILAYIIVTTILGSVLHLFGGGEIIEQSISNNVPIYRKFMFDKYEFWTNPIDGFISGKILEVNDNAVKIVDFNNNIWIVNIDEAFIGPRAEIKIGQTVKIIGDVNNEIFEAEEIRPWMGRINRHCCSVR